MGETEKRVPTGIVGLDEMLRGGFIQGSTVLVRGAPGTGKTAMGLQYLVHGAQQWGEGGLLISFEEFPQSIHRDAASLGWDLTALEKSGKLHLLFTSPQVLLSNLEIPSSPLNELLMTGQIQRVVVDSVTHFQRITRDPHDLRRIYNSLVNALRREGVTSLLLGEEKRTTHLRADRGRLSFIVDAIILLRYVEIESAIQRAMVVLKMRGSDHDKEIRRYEIRQGGLVVLEPFKEQEGLLTGIPHRIAAPARR